MTIEDAYAIQTAWIGIKRAEGRIIKGHKIGLTSKAMRSALNIDEPDSGVLLDDMAIFDREMRHRGIVWEMPSAFSFASSGAARSRLALN